MQLREIKLFPPKLIKPALCALAFILVSLGSYFRVFELYELQTYDWRCQIRGPRPVLSDIVHVDIYDDTVEQLGAFPFDRKYHAGLIQALAAFGAKAVFFDIVFADPAPSSDPFVVQTAKAANNVYFGYVFSDPKAGNGVVTATKMGSAVLPDYQRVARGSGFLNTKADIDGKRRRVMPVIQMEGKNYYHLMFSLAADLYGDGSKNIFFNPGKSIQLSKDIEIPLDEEGCFSISYAGKWEKTFEHKSYFDIIYSHDQIINGEEPAIDTSFFKNKICIVGLTTSASHDTSPIPIQSVYPMVGSQSNVLNNIIQKDFIRRASRSINLLLLACFASLLIWILFHQRPLKALFYTLAIMSLFMELVVGAFFAFGWWLDLFYPMVIFAALYASMTLGRVLLEMRKRELIESELKIASQIQKSFLPATMPEVPGFSMAVHFRPAKAVGGDLYAFIPLTDKNKLGVMAGDVSGKGTPAALFMAKAVSEFKFAARSQLDPSKALCQVNDAISSDSTGGLFVTMSYAIFDVVGGRMVLSNGGHLPVVTVKADGTAEELMPEEGMPIGVMEGVTFANLERPVERGEVFAFYSDGVSEARNPKKEEYGIQRLSQVISQYRAGSAQEILDQCIKALDRFMAKAEQHDDITLIVVKTEDTDRKS